MQKPEDEKTEGGGGKAETPSGSGGDAAAGPGGRSTSSSPSQAGAARGAQATAAQAAKLDAVALLKQDHRTVEGLFDQYQHADDKEKDGLCRQICAELIIHSEIEERIFYPAARQPSTEQRLDEAQVEHDAAKVLILDLMKGDDEYRDAKIKVLSEEIRQHIREEEAPDGVLAKAQKAGANTRELAERLTQLKGSLQQRGQEGRLPTPQPVTFELADLAREVRMPRDYRDRDDDRGGRGRYRDDEGRFTSGRGRYDEDRDRGRGGWYGDPEGHAEASRLGWEERRGESRSYRGRDDDDERRYGRSRDRGQGGWFGDPRGHAEAAREGWEERRGERRSYGGRDDDDRRYATRGGSGRDRGQGGWFGDPEGHSEAARRGWDEREERYGGGRRYPGREDEARFTSRRGRDDDDDRRGRGGWYGDAEGHSEAARRGWDERR